MPSTVKTFEHLDLYMNGTGASINLQANDFSSTISILEPNVPRTTSCTMAQLRSLFQAFADANTPGSADLSRYFDLVLPESTFKPTAEAGTIINTSVLNREEMDGRYAKTSTITTLTTGTPVIALTKANNLKYSYLNAGTTTMTSLTVSHGTETNTDELLLHYFTLRVGATAPTVTWTGMIWVDTTLPVLTANYTHVFAFQYNPIDNSIIGQLSYKYPNPA